MLGTWKAGLEALRKEGARLVDADGVEHRFEVQATDHPGECQRDQACACFGEILAN